jgi:hypothetical protein
VEIKFLTADAILESKDAATEAVACPEWGGDVNVRAMNAHERGQFIAATVLAKTERNMGEAEALLVTLCAVNESGDRLFTDDMVPRLALKNATPVHRIAEAALRLSGLTGDAVAVVKKD